MHLSTHDMDIEKGGGAGRRKIYPHCLEFV